MMNYLHKSVGLIGLTEINLLWAAAKTKNSELLLLLLAASNFQPMSALKTLQG